MKRKFLLLWFLYSFLFCTSAKYYNNIVYVDKNVRFTLISDGVIRMEYSPDSNFIDNTSFIAVNRKYPKVQCEVTQNYGLLTVKTRLLSLNYKLNTGKFSKDNTYILYSDGDFSFEWKPGDKQKRNLKGTHRTLDGMDGDTQSQTWVPDSKKGEKINLGDGILSFDGWTLIDDSKGFLFDGNKNWNWVKERENIDNTDWYFMAYGHNYKKALKDYTLFAGKVPLPPRYAFGYWWSRFWAYSDKEYRNLIDKFDTYNIPLDVLVMDMDWHQGGWTGWSWNKNLFPDPTGFLSYLEDRNIKATLNIHPADGFSKHEDAYKNIALDMGIDSGKGERIPWISSDKKLMRSLFKNVLTPMENEGVDFWWLDWQQDMYDSNMNNLNNTWWINYVFFSQMENFTDRRPLLYHRWGGLGNHRYQVGFSGDAVISWKSLEFQPYFNLTASNVLYGYWSHDLGGHLGRRIEPELYIRWMQFGAFSPIMRTHSQKTENLNKEPWMYNPDQLEILRNTIIQRYEMHPYIYTMARKTYDEGLSICRPLYYDYPDNKEAYEFRNEYMFGDDILIAPITSPSNNGYSLISVWLPEGIWYEMHTGTVIKGNRVIDRYFSIDEYPIYIKAGSILPFYCNNVKNLSKNNEPIILTVFPGNRSEKKIFNLYEDAGTNKNYDFDFAFTKIESEYIGNNQHIIINKRIGKYKGMGKKRNYIVKILSPQIPERIKLNNEDVDFYYSSEEFAIIIDLKNLKCDKKNTLIISYRDKNIEYNGLLSSSRRLAKSFDKLKYRSAFVKLNSELSRMGVLNEAISYDPDNVSELIEEFWNNYKKLPEILDKQKLKEEDKIWILNYINWGETIN